MDGTQPTNNGEKTMSYNFNRRTRNSKMFTFADGSKLRVIRTAQKGEETTWDYINFEPNQARSTNMQRYEGNDWRWIDAQERAEHIAYYIGGTFTVKNEKKDSF